MRFAPAFGNPVKQPIAQWFIPDTTQREVLGRIVLAVDPYWGYGEFIYAKAAAALNVGNLCVMQAGSFGATGAIQMDKVPNTANLGQNVFVALSEMAISTFGWFCKAGSIPTKQSATVAAAAALGIVSAGVLGAVANGKQVNGAIQLISATGTLAKSNVQTFNGNGILKCPGGYDGWFLGAALSGTGIPASTVVAALDPDGFTVYTGSAVGTLGDKNSTASGSVTVTATYTGYGIANFNNPFAQGQVT